MRASVVTILDEILEHKRREVERAKALISEEEMADLARRCREPLRGFRRSLLASEPPAIIAEIKRRSPSKGEIRADFDPAACARAYAEGGAATLSVLTDERYFGGHLDYLDLAARSCALPLLRKDFIVDPYQIDEARVARADAILLIVAALEPGPLQDLHGYARERGLDVLVEVHDAAELERAAKVGADLIGINNRDLRTFKTELSTTEALAPRAPEDALLVAESGIFAPADIERLRACGARAFLVGESLMREPDPGAALRRLRGAS